MSRIGKLPIPIPEKVSVEIAEQQITVTGPHGSLNRQIHEKINMVVENNQIHLSRKDQSRDSLALHGLSRTLINNMIIGVSQKFEKRLDLRGVGYRAQVSGQQLTLNLGYSHPVILTPPDDIQVKVESNTKVIVQGINKETVGQFVATIRNKRLPEPYKGKGILYEGEIINRKVGKSGK